MGDLKLPNIRYLAFARVSDGLILATYSKNSAATKAVRLETPPPPLFCHVRCSPSATL